MSDLSEYRRRIDDIDGKLVVLLAERLDICRQVAEYKRAHDIAMMQSGRVGEVKDRVASSGAEHGVSPQLMRELYGLIIAEACRLEDEIIDGI